MKRILLIVASLGSTLAAPTVSHAQSNASAPPISSAPAAFSLPSPVSLLPVPKTVPIILDTSLGPVTIALEVERAPLTAGNFLKYVDEKRLDGTVFYRSFTWDDGTPGGFIQGGTQNDPKRILKPVPHEPTSVTGLSHTDGTISMAQGAPGTATGDFFIIIGDLRGFDASADQPGFAAFGRVVSGMDVIRAIGTSARSTSAGEGVMKGQMLDPTIRIRTARRAPVG